MHVLLTERDLMHAAIVAEMATLLIKMPLDCAVCTPK